MAELTARLEADGRKLTTLATPAPGAAGEIAAAWCGKGCDLVVVAGGDGTINEVLQGMHGRETPLAILPGGTANVLAIEAGLGTDMLRAAARLGELVPRLIPTGRVADWGAAPRLFLSMAGVGLDARVIHDLRPAWKERLGKAAYWLGGFSRIAARLEQFQVEAAGQAFRSSYLLASRVRNYGGDIAIARRATLVDDDFEVVAFSGTRGFRYLPYLARVVAGRIEGARGVTVLRASRLRLTPEGSDPVYLQVDGELAGVLPATVELVPDALRLLLPRGYPDRHG